MALDTPSKGGRVVLTRKAVREDEVVYEVRLHAPEGTWQGDATIIIADGAIALPDFGGDAQAPPWLVDMARAFLRTVWSARRKEDPPRWPRRLRRWRAAKG